MTVSTDIVSSRTLLPESKKTYAKIAHVLDIPHLISMQINSFEWFLKERAEGAVRRDLADPGLHRHAMELRFGEYSFGEPKYSEAGVPRARHDVFAAPLRVNVELHRQGDGRGQGAGAVHGRLPAHDAERHLHHQRRRARRRLAARALARRLLHARRRTRPPAATWRTPS